MRHLLSSDYRWFSSHRRENEKHLQKGGSQARTEKAVKIDDAPNKVPHVAK